MNKNFQKKTAYDHVKQTKKENFRFLNEKYAQQGQTVLFGDSITEIFNSYELFYAFSQTTGQAVYNRGISGDTSDRLLERLECNALNINPKNLVILIGTNDIGIGLQTEYTLRNIQEILQRTQKLCPNTNIVLQAIIPLIRICQSLQGRWSANAVTKRFWQSTRNCTKSLLKARCNGSTLQKCCPMKRADLQKNIAMTVCT